MDWNKTTFSEEELLEELSSREEDTRYKALVKLRDPDVAITEALVRRTHEMLNDSSRPVRDMAREILQTRVRTRSEVQGEISPERDTSPYPGSMLLALISWASALTGILGTAFCILSYYLEKKLPFPNAIDTIVIVNLVLTLPYLVIGLLLLFPGKGIKQLAYYHGILSLLLCLALVVGTIQVFEAYWAIQFTTEDAERFRNFLSPFQMALLLMPVIAGQSLQIYFLSGYLGGRRGSAQPIEVDTTEHAE